MALTATFESEQAVQRLIKLAYAELCRVEGSILLAEERIEKSGGRMAGRQREQAEQTIAKGPKQAGVLEEALEALRDALRTSRNASKE
jgi:hypothetical protein